MSLINVGGICSEPPAISNGRVSVLGGSQQHLKYHCDSGFLLWGASDLVCLGNNTYENVLIYMHKELRFNTVFS